MKKILVFIFMTITYGVCNGQISAITETGDEVILYEDGSWKYADSTEVHTVPINEIPLSPTPFEKNSSSSFAVKSTRSAATIWIDPKKWSFKKGERGGAAEYTFSFEDGDIYGMLISEQLDIPIESLRDIVIKNAQSVAPDIKVEHEEFRIVNKRKVLFIRMSGTLSNSIRFTYFGYYYSDKGNSIQLVTYTTKNLADQYASECESLLNGLEIVLD